ncbi:MAG: ATP-binding protein, partial [Spirochaetales bacterium]|nr:ATP-binding protein [Spirochaetales bacterium]
VPEGSIIWSDKFISSLTGDTSLGAISRSGDLTIITELSLEGLLTTFDVISSGPDRIWVIDRKGELVIDTGSRDGSAFINVREVPFMKAALRGEAVSEQVRFGNRSYYIRYTRSDQLGWLFLIGIPAGIEHFLVYNTLISLLLMMVTFLVISMIIFPFWTTRLSKDVGFLRDQAVAISNGTAPKEFSRGVVSEFRELSSYMGKMYAKIRGREEDLKLLNQNLEEIVDERTRELSRRNDELNNTLDDLSKMQNILIQSEKLAALGRMVAGVAHELNTPLGNANMAVTSLRDFQHDLQNKLDSGLKRSDLNSYLEHSLHGIDIAERNLNRAAEMVVSFKHVANDQTTSARRKFKLLEVIHDVIITLQPTIKRSPHRVKISNNPDIEMDSFPGVVGQIISNLINNALIHAWPEGGKGKISLSIEAISSPFENTGALEKDWVEIRVADNGKGIPEEYGQRIFDPFFTSRMGSGGTGLGLNIVHNSAENILGGLIRYEEAEGGGTVFILQIPAIAPKMI